MSQEYYEVTFEEIDSCEYTVEAPSKKGALKFATKLWKKEHKNIPIFACLSHYQTIELPKRVETHLGKEDIKKILTKP